MPTALRRSIGGIVAATLMTGGAVLIASSGTASAASGYITLQCDKATGKEDATCTASSAPVLIPPGAWLQTSDVPEYRCPANFPWLLNKNYDGATIAPNGAQAVRESHVGVNLGWTPARNREGRAVGTNRGGTATSWTVAGGTVRIVLHCTKVVSQSY